VKEKKESAGPCGKKEEKEKVSGPSWATAAGKRLGQRGNEPMRNRRIRKAFINFWI
jgi:hypothetical protein